MLNKVGSLVPSDTSGIVPEAKGVRLKAYLLITKPGIILGNLISVFGGFFLASRGALSFALLLYTTLGISLVIAAGCALNNCIDRDIDSQMERTRQRVMVRGLIPLKLAILYACLVGLSGFVLLYAKTNVLTVLLAGAGFIIYVGTYSLYFKRHSVYGTLIGSLSGAVPPVIGYTAVSNQFDTAALLLLLIFSLWQMPHSYAIAIFRIDDYRAANIPVLPVNDGITKSKVHIVCYILAFTVAALMLYVTGYTGLYYLIVVALISLYWLGLAMAGYKTRNDQFWAKKLFIFSIMTITAVSIMMSIDFQRL